MHLGEREHISTKLHFQLKCQSSHDELRDMKYLRAVLNETLRLFPPGMKGLFLVHLFGPHFCPVPFNMRETIGETTWVDDDGGKLYIPANTRYACNCTLTRLTPIACIVQCYFLSHAPPSKRRILGSGCTRL